MIKYLIETYDKDQRISFVPSSHESYHARQMLHFQMSGQGPYYGQAVWFKRYHPEHVQSNRQWLVGDKLSYADLAFVSWQKGAVGSRKRTYFIDQWGAFSNV
ncbi:glutathione S-transferase Ure2-like protein [Penicillium odoratum]|uniref:glutathione S-transferase Ure2-like protein n=1 Tax=Penicillium odoratum TaxID=1167516 RepID=UPI002549537A|nr:glutathione S-transferase Ure2-like protein [Penicillium odoratum]KAJ5758381.1 glutathione S-transferase Ure2-like protein [Penicillium odoratum]